MLAIVICDDDLIFARRFGASLKSAFKAKGVSCKLDVYDNANELLSAMNSQFYDIVCLDIRIGNSSGIAVGNHIRDKQKNMKSQIVYISSYDSYHRDGRLYGAVPMAFVKKPFTDSHIEDIVTKTITRFSPRQKPDKYLTFEYNRKKYSIKTSEIIYVEAQLRKKTIHTTNGQEYLTLSNMQNIIKSIDDPDFILVHQSFLVNAHFIDHITNTDVILKTGKVLPVSSTQHEDARLAIVQFCKRKGALHE